MLTTARPEFDETDVAAVASVLDSGWLGAGPVVGQFESALRERTSGSMAVAVATGTAALHLGLLAAGVEPGDEVVLPSMTFVATVQAVLACGAVPVFADVDPRDGLLDPADVERRMTPSTAAVLVVHYAGAVADTPALRAIARERGVLLVEDAAHSFGSDDHGAPCGAASDVACFSFDPIKPLTCGQGGAVVVQDPGLAERIRRNADLGISGRLDDGTPVVKGFGLRYRMSDLNAAIGLSQLERFDRRVARRRWLWERYVEAFEGLPGVEVLHHDPQRMVPFLFPVLVGGDRNAFRQHLLERQVGTGVHYGAAHRNPTFGAEPVELPGTDEFAARVVTLPFHPTLTDDDVDTVIDSVRGALRVSAQT